MFHNEIIVSVKILIGLTYYLPNISGVTQYVSILSDELVTRSHKIRIICSKSKSPLPAGRQAQHPSLNKEGATIINVNGFSIGKGFVMPMYWYKSIEQVRWSDVVNCHLPSIESFWLALWGRIFRKNIIVTHHCEFMFTGSLSNKLIAFLSWPIHFFVYLLANNIVAYTKDYASHSSFLKIFKNKIIFILPPIKIKSINHNKQNKMIIGYVGRIAWEKGLDRLIEIIPKLKSELGDNFEMWWVGPYKNVKGDNFYKKLKIKKEIKLIGPVDHENLNKYYAKMDCLVLPSTDNLETFGIVQAEAMVCGVPVVASNLPGVRVPVLTTGMGEIASVTDNNDLAKKIIMVIKNKIKYINRAKNLNLFDYKKTVNEYEKVFEKLLR
jgi:glycosyltransferase involved in cell wall biosynthesis